MRIVRWLGIVVASLCVLLLGIGVVARFSDGPIGFFAGGPLRAGPLVSEPVVEWPVAASAELQTSAPFLIELQLLEPPVSRKTGVMLHEGELYVPCDLGYFWRRFSGPRRWILHLIYVFKRWHEDALRDGRVLLRIDGTRYERQAVLVTDPELAALLRSELGKLGEQWYPLAEAPTDGPRDIWFFRMDPRPAE